MTRRTLFGTSLIASAAQAADPPGWERRLHDVLPEFGHRNWIVVADSAYPAQSRPSIQTLVTAAGHSLLVSRVLAALASSKHVVPNVYTDLELKFVAESDAPGISEYRRQLGTALKGHAVNELAHEQLIAKLDEAGKTFQVLIVKSTLTLPYTSVFFELECKYWSAGAEERLRAAMRK